MTSRSVFAEKVSGNSKFHHPAKALLFDLSPFFFNFSKHYLFKTFVALRFKYNKLTLQTV